MAQLLLSSRFPRTLVQAGTLAAGVLALAAGTWGCETIPVRNCGAGQVYQDGECVVPHAVRVNSVGYFPDRAKVATYVGDSTSFRVKTLDGRVVLEGEASGEIRTRDTGEKVRHADFSELRDPGEYYLEVPGVGRSPEFRIASDVFEKPLVATLLGLYGQRCGTAVELEWDETTFSHEVCHEKEPSLQFIEGADGTKDARGGWHDAGDYGRYTVNGAFAVAFVLKAYEDFPDRLAGLELPIPERGGDTPDVLDEARYQLEWLLKMQLADGSASHKVTAQRFEGEILPENDGSALFFVPAGTAATANFAAALALAARVYEPFDAAFAERCLTAAQQAFDFLLANREPITPDQSQFSTGAYERPGYDDERAWAAAELWKTTGDAAALEEFELLFGELGFMMRRNFDWDDATNLALLTYLSTEREGRDEAIVDGIRTMALNTADSLVSDAQSHGYGRALGGLYYWGINGVLARTAYNLIAAHRIEPDAKYLDAVTAQVDHLLGRNPYGRSYVTGVGYRPARFPHHRPSMAGGSAWPGLLIGGPHTGLQGEGREPVPEGLTWEDASDNYRHNEVAINWNTALVYALVASE
jgi:endoglucanase